MTATDTSKQILSAEKLLEHWQGHRKLTRRVIEAFPEDKLFTFSIAGMRPFSELAMEFVKMTEPIVHGVATGEWKEWSGTAPRTKAELLVLWDQSTEALNRIFPRIPEHRFAESDKAFGKWESPGIGVILYAIDNEVHHRGQGYVYLRALGVEPPPFWER